MDDERKGMDNFPRWIYDPRKPELFPALIIIYPLSLFSCGSTPNLKKWRMNVVRWTIFP